MEWQGGGRPAGDGPPGEPGGRTGRLGRRAEHLLRRAAFGVSADEERWFEGSTYDELVDALVDYDRVPDTVDEKIGRPGFVGVTARGPFLPNTTIGDARQRWLFRLVHTDRPLQEKMALFWHNHFATAYGKIAGILGTTEAVRVLAAVPSEDPAGVTGQIEMFRARAVGNFRDLLVAVARDPAMLVWLDGRLNTRTRPQENFARELMELFTVGVGSFTEEDVYAAARVFTGWNLQRVGSAADPAAHWEFFYNVNQHDTNAKAFSFPIYPDGGRTIPARSASAGMQDGLDLITALAGHPETARRLARRLHAFFVDELHEPDARFIDGLAHTYLEGRFEVRPVLRRLFTSAEFFEASHVHARYSWPVEFAVRLIKEVGWTGFSVNDVLAPLGNMGQVLFEPPDVSGWDGGPAWFSSGTMLARTNFAATLARSQRTALAALSTTVPGGPQELVGFFLRRLRAAPFDSRTYADLTAYVDAGGWTGSESQRLARIPGLVRLIGGSANYQFV